MPRQINTLHKNWRYLWNLLMNSASRAPELESEILSPASPFRADATNATPPRETRVSAPQLPISPAGPLPTKTNYFSNFPHLISPQEGNATPVTPEIIQLLRELNRLTAQGLAVAERSNRSLTELEKSSAPLTYR